MSCANIDNLTSYFPNLGLGLGLAPEDAQVDTVIQHCCSTCQHTEMSNLNKETPTWHSSTGMGPGLSSAYPSCPASTGSQPSSFCTSLWLQAVSSRGLGLDLGLGNTQRREWDCRQKPSTGQAVCVECGQHTPDAQLPQGQAGLTNEESDHQRQCGLQAGQL